MNSQTAILTICSINYLSKALIFVRSSRLHHAAATHFILLVDRKTDLRLEDDIQVIWAENLGITNFYQKAFCFDIIELNTNLKPRAMQWLLETFERVIYCDPDMCVYAPMDDIWRELGDGAVLLTPHYYTPIQDAQKPNDWELLKFGVFNLGFIAVQRHSSTEPFLAWWSERCLEHGYFEPQTGLAVDQKWISLAPGFFKGIIVSRNLGLNVAFWNLHERVISHVNGQWWINDTVQLLLMHFSSFDANNADVVAQKQTRVPNGSRPDFEAIAVGYRQQLNLSRERFNGSTVQYSFAAFADGQPISRTLRRVYAGLKFSDSDPFAVNSDAYRLAARHRLWGRRGVQSERINFRDLERHSNTLRFALWGLKWVQRVLGAERYFDLMRFLVHISSIRVQASAYKDKS